MRIGILGAGRMADALGTQWVRAGHEVVVSGRDPGRTAAAAASIGARHGTWQDAATYGDVVLLAVREDGVSDVLDATGGLLRGRTVIDCTNPVVGGGLLSGNWPVAERVAEATGARVVKAFNLCHEDVWRMTPPVFDGAPLAVPICGDDGDALAVVSSLIADVGCTPVPGGGLERAGQQEAVAAFMIGLWIGGVDARATVPPLAYAFGVTTPGDLQAEDETAREAARRGSRAGP